MTNTSLGLEIFVRFYYKICSTKPKIATTLGFLYIKKKSCGKYSQWNTSPMFFINYTAIIIYSWLHVSDPLLSPCYSTTAERRPADRTPFTSSSSCHASSSPLLPQIPLQPSIHSRQRMLVVMVSASNRHFDLAILGQRCIVEIQQ
jgi:hypothetical protein